ncbi:phage holin family protein [Flavobacterium sp.]|uniref:phage holin family protein n=1 Tax=Flavobacterium sp. TaxID=239 RepID=UPI0025C60B6B|nr:phage holin family protein [Flavobacterium sp.]MBA4154145.1 hypothetical protein [Flavobacterium sp.]
MNKFFNYILQGFGYVNAQDFMTTVFKCFYFGDLKIFLTVAFTFGTLREFIIDSSGLDLVFWLAFSFLIVAEWQTGINVDIKKGNKFRSRKFGRMILKIGVYIGILVLINSFAKSTKTIIFGDFEVNPFGWVFYVVVVAITFQMLISWFENLGNLGYKEAGGLAGIILRRYNKWFEFDGQKDGDNFNNQRNDSPE